MSLITLIGAICLAASAISTDKGTDQTIGPEKGSLLIIGGGKHNSAVMAKFIELAGGVERANIVVIPTANMTPRDTGKTPLTLTPVELKSLGIKNVTVLHTADRRVADTDAFVAPLKSATGVWFDGGRQWHLADSYLATKTLQELRGVLARGGVLAGTSAGATILGEYLWRGDTSGPDILEGDHNEGFAFLKKTAIDQHILVRNRQFDLVPFIEKHPDMLGIGINEETAIWVEGNDFEVVGASVVAITDAKQWEPGAHSPNSAAQKGKIYFLSPGTKFDLQKRAVISDSNHK